MGCAIHGRQKERGDDGASDLEVMRLDRCALQSSYTSSYANPPSNTEIMSTIADELTELESRLFRQASYLSS